MWFIAIIGLYMAQTITVLFAEYRHPGKTVAWLTIVTLLPVVGFVLYYFLAQEYKTRRRIKRYSGEMTTETRAYFKSLTKPAHEAAEANDLFGNEYRHLMAFLSRQPEAPLTLRNVTTVYSDGKRTIDAMLEAISQATDHIHVQFYIFRSDRVGLQFQRILIDKARKGVVVKVIVDGVGSYDIGKHFVAEMKEAGVEVYVFLPVPIAFFDKRINFRNHRKIIVVDGKVAFMGGVNIGDEYVGEDPKFGFWRDTHLRIEGDAVYYIQHMFMTDWALASGKAMIAAPRYYPAHEITQGEAVQIIASGPDNHWDVILEMFFAAITSATKYIYITTPYFIPESSIIMALKTAAISGVDVRIILPAIPDSRLVQWASLSYLEEMMQAGVSCYLYKKGFVHAKTLIVDGVMASVGTANMDMRSFFSNFEMNAVLFDAKTIERLLADFQEDLIHSSMIELLEISKRPVSQKVKEIGARLLSPLL